jgi:hypothetical protein
MPSYIILGKYTTQGILHRCGPPRIDIHVTTNNHPHTRHCEERPQERRGNLTSSPDAPSTPPTT